MTQQTSVTPFAWRLSLVRRRLKAMASHRVLPPSLVAAAPKLSKGAYCSRGRSVEPLPCPHG